MWKLLGRIEAVLAVVLLAAMVLTIFFSAVLRFAGKPIAAGPEIAQLLLIWTCMLGADIVMRRGDHIRVPALSKLVSPMLRKIILGVCITATLALLLTLTWLGYALTVSNWARRLGALDVSYGLVTMALPVGTALMSISLIQRVLTKGIDQALDTDATSLSEGQTL